MKTLKTITFEEFMAAEKVHAENARYQVYCDRGNGPELDGCWGSEHAQFETDTDAQECCDQLAEQYPDCEWSFQPIEPSSKPGYIPPCH